VRSGPDDSLNGSADSPADRAVLFFMLARIAAETDASGLTIGAPWGQVAVALIGGRLKSLGVH
jgi:hypothetical protein